MNSIDSELRKSIETYKAEKLADLLVSGFQLHDTIKIGPKSYDIWVNFENECYVAALFMTSGELTWGHGDSVEEAVADLVNGVTIWLGY